MAAKVIRTGRELVQYIFAMAKTKKITMSSLERMSNIGTGCISKWNKADPGTSNALKVLSALEVYVILIDKQSEFDEMPLDLNDEYLKELSEISTDAKILYAIKKALQNPNLTVSDKQKLCKVIEAFI